MQVAGNFLISTSQLDHSIPPQVELIDLGKLLPRCLLGEAELNILSRVVADALDNPGVTVICFCGSDSSFLLGADRRQFARWIAASELKEVMRFTQHANDLLRRIEQSAKRTIAWIEGVAVGAGLELALACQEIVAGPKARFRLPETEIGIYPGMGGTQRLPRRVGIGLGKWMIYAGFTVPAMDAKQMGLIDRILPEGAGLKELLCSPDSLEGTRNNDLKWESLEGCFSTHSLEHLLDPQFAQSQNMHVARACFSLRQKPRLALQLAEQVIDGGYAVPLEEGLTIERAYLPTVFQSQAAVERLGRD